MEHRTSSSRRPRQEQPRNSADYSQRQAQPSFQSYPAYPEGRDPSISTASPYTPTTPSFPAQGGLAPRPSSFPYSGETSEPVSRPPRRPKTRGKEPIAPAEPERRPTTRGKDRSLYEKPLPPDPPPAAPDAPRAPPPVSYRALRINGGPPTAYQRNPRSFSERVQGAAVGSGRPIPSGSYDPSPYIDRQGSSGRRRSDGGAAAATTPISQTEAEGHYLSATAAPSSTTQRSGSKGTSSRSQAVATSPPSRTNSRKVSQAPNGAAQQQAIDWAHDRSPLQKLELTLQDISREEERADQEEAQIIAREARGGRGGRRVNQGGSGTVPTAAVPVAGPSNLAEAGLVRSLSNKQKERLQRSATIDSRKTPSDSHSPGPDTGRGFEYQEQQYIQEPAAPAPVAQASPPVRVSSTRYRPEGAQPGVTSPAGNALTNTNSSTEHKDRRHNRHQSVQIPPMGQQRSKGPQEDEQAYADRPQGPLIYDATGAHDQGAPRSFQSQESARPAIVDNTTGPRMAVPSKKTGGQKARDLLGIQSGPGRHHHPFTSMLHHGRKDGSQSSWSSSSERVAAPASPRLEEWRQGRVARLTAADFSLENEVAVTDKDKAWWEGGSTGRRRASTGARTSAPSNAGFTDGQYGHGNGMSNLIQFRTVSQVTDNPSGIRRRIDPVLPRSRQFIGFEGTSESTSQVKRRNRFLKLGFHRLETAGPELEIQDFSLSPFPYVFSFPPLAENSAFHPFHVFAPTNRLTRSARAIHIRIAPAPTSFRPPLFLKCGPLLQYRGLRKPQKAQRPGSTALDREIWAGSVMIVTLDSDSSYEIAPTLRLFYQPVDLLPPPPAQLDGESGELPPEYVDPIAGLPKVSRTGKTLYVKPVEHLEEERDLSRIEDDNGIFEATKSPPDLRSTDGAVDRKKPLAVKRAPGDGEKLGKYKEVKGVRLLAERGVTFWRFNIELELGERQARMAYRINRGPAIGFWVPGRGESMNVMFHSCNGFSLSVNPNQFSGPDPLWRDVLSTHQTKPFHAMIGGGDQVYNDAVMQDEKTILFQDWLHIKNPIHKHTEPFSVEMKEELENFYLDRYAMWFSQGLFGMANSQIPMINMWDDHDIIDGFGSYPHHFMSSPVFKGLGAVAHKYYMLFQQQSVVDELEADEPSWLLGAAPGPYINELSRSIFMFLGRKIAFLGLDCRTERMRDEILSRETYSRIFDRCRREIVKGQTRHLLVLLGVPIAYPRLVWLETILTSRIMDPVKALGRAGMFGGFINKFDGGVEILDDLDDHWTAKNHKAERNWFIQELQELAAEKSVRVTILGGDVHLAAIGQFYSNPKLGIPKDRDHRYMPNIISSAIVNTPPPEMLGDILNKRNKVHHLDPETDEDMIPIFTHDVDGKPRNNKHLLPRRNWCSIGQYKPGTTPPQTPQTPQVHQPPMGVRLTRTLSLSRQNPLPNIFRRNSRRGPQGDTPGLNGRQVTESADVIPRPLSSGNDGYFPLQPLPRPSVDHSNLDQHRIAGGPDGGLKRTLTKGRGAAKGASISLDDGLEVVINCEVSQKDPAGITTPYRLLVPALYHEGGGDACDEELKGRRWSLWGRRKA